MNHATVVAPLTLSRRLTVFLHAVMFVLGFSIVFVVGFGGIATTLGGLFGEYRTQLAQIGGLVVIVFGLATLRIIKIPWLYYDTRPQWERQSQGGLWASVLMGVFFAAGWTPCVGTTLGAILTLGWSQETVWQGMFLATGYALGLGLPFLAIGLAMDQAGNVVRRFRKHIRTIEIINGIFLILIGVLLFSGRMTLIASWAQSAGWYLDVPLGEAITPSYAVSIVAGLFSFLSPCVLPLVPAYVGYLSGHAISHAHPPEKEAGEVREVVEE
jgi:cytochrome c-type biogenesis protein